MGYENNFNAYASYYPQTAYQQQQRPIMNQYVFVNGIDGAKAFQMLPNQTILLMDNDNPYVYMKSANQLGQTSIRYFKLMETSEQELRGVVDVVPTTEYALKKDLDELKEQIKKLTPKGEK
mgnify:CR=1 FL=1